MERNILFAGALLYCVALGLSGDIPSGKVKTKSLRNVSRTTEEDLFSDDEDLAHRLSNLPVHEIKSHVKRQTSDDFDDELDGSGDLDNRPLQPLEPLDPFDPEVPGPYPPPSYPSDPSYPSYPSDPSYPSYPSDPSYPSYPSYPSKKYPSYPSYPSKSYPSYPSKSYASYNYPQQPCAGYPSTYRYCRKTRHCYPCVSSSAYGSHWYGSYPKQSHCGAGKVFVEDDAYYGSCRCARPNYVMWKRTNTCYPLYSKGPCTSGNWLEPKGKGYSTCRTCPCPQQADGRHIYWNSYGSPGCYKSYTRGPCHSGKYFVINNYVSRQATCVSPARYYSRPSKYSYGKSYQQPYYYRRPRVYRRRRPVYSKKYSNFYSPYY